MTNALQQFKQVLGAGTLRSIAREAGLQKRAQPRAPPQLGLCVHSLLPGVAARASGTI
jgi:hypothetical protein